MKNFADYVIQKQLSELFYDYNVDVDNFCENVLSSYDNEQKLNEFVQKLARGISGLFGSSAGMARDAAGAVGGAAKGAAGAVGGAVGRALKGAAGAVGSAASSVGKYVGDKYEQGRRQEAIRQINDRIKGLENALVSLGLDKSKVSSFLTQINSALLKAAQSGQMATISKSSDVRAAERARLNEPGAEAWEGLGRQMAAQERGRDAMKSST